MTAVASVVRARVLPDSYRDSVELMGIAAQVEQQPGIDRAGLLMGTPANVEVLRDAGLFVDTAATAGPADLVVAVAGHDEQAVDEAMALAERLLAGRERDAGNGEGDGSTTAARAGTLAEALAEDPDARLAMVSTPGSYATAEAWKALKLGLHVFLFSDNVPVEDEIELKEAAIDRGLLLMGPDCGTAIIDGVPLGFANAVGRGGVGIVAASGTGLQEVSCLLDRGGAGISQAIGVGGRDLSTAVGGRMMVAGLRLLAADPATEVIVCVSKPPAAEVAAEVMAHVRDIGKPVVVCFLGGDRELVADSAALFAPTLEAAAHTALEALGRAPARDADVEAAQIRLAEGQNRIRGLFCGGTLASEATVVLAGETPDATQRCDITDLGADEYTRGRPHPMIEPALRNPFLEEAALDPSVAVIMLDVVLGHGSHPDPAGTLVPAVHAARQRAGDHGRELAVVASVCGTNADPQGFDRQVRILTDAGVLVAASNAQAARLAARLAFRA